VPRRHRTPGTAADWLARATSSLALAQVAKPEEALWEDLCFNAQQAAEKAIKGMLTHGGIEFPLVHDLADLLELAETNGIPVPDDVKRSARLTQYASLTRYPFAGETATEAEHAQAVELARTVIAWARKAISPDRGTTS